MPADRQTRSVVIGAGSIGVRRSLSPAAWIVLEELMLRSAATGGHRVARVSVRSLAGSLGLAKDTAARAVRRLRAAGLVSGAQQRTASGVFDTGVYVITVPAEIISVKTTSAKPRQSAIRSREPQLPLVLEA